MSTAISSVLEDYLENILILEREKQGARLKDIAEAMEVRSPSALEALASLEAQGLVRHESYSGFELTPQGRQVAKKIYTRHKGLKKFFMNVLGIGDAIAESDACQVEHYLSAQTISRIMDFADFLEQCPRQKPICLQKFHARREKAAVGPCLCQEAKRSHA